MKEAAEWQRRLDAAAPGLVEGCRLVGTRPRSVILRGRSAEFGDVCIKYDPKPAGRARMQAEYDALRAYHAAGRDGPFGAPRPCAMVPDPQGGAALVTSWISCPRADDRLAPAMPLAGVRQEVLRRAAAWLADFHRLGPAEDVPLRSALDLVSLGWELGAVLGADGGGANGDRGPGALAQAIECGADAAVRVTSIHGDFLPQNLFLCREDTIGIDFTLGVTGPALRDVGTFLANMVWRGYSTLDPRRPTRFARDARAFVDAYFEGATPPQWQAARLFLLAELARKARGLSAKIAGRRLGVSDRLHRMMILGAIRALLRPAFVAPGRTPA